METGEDGRLTMTVTLPDAKALDNLARSLAHLFAPGRYTGITAEDTVLASGGDSP